MEFKDNTNVYSSDGKEVGSLTRIVIEPETKDVTHIVTQSGLLIKDDKVIPVEKVALANRERVLLNCTADEIKEMAPLTLEEKVPVSGDTGLSRRYDPISGSIFSDPIAERATITQTKRTIPEDLVALKEGARVMSEDDTHIGNVESVFTEPESVNVSHFGISQGLLVKTRKTIPVEWVKMLDEERINLAVEAQEVENLRSEED